MMKINVHKIIASFILCIAVAVNAVNAGDKGHYKMWRVIELRVNEQPFFGELHFNDTPLHRGVHYSKGYSTIYVAEVFPNNNYTLGVTFPIVHKKVAVSLFDRWPFEYGAKMFKLPTHSIAAGSHEKYQYRWSFGISEYSSSSLLYILMETDPSDLQLSHMPHNIFITTQPLRALINDDDEISYLRGPGNIELVGEQGSISYVIEDAESPYEIPGLPSIPINGDLIKNSWFEDGLNHWLPHTNYTLSEDVQFSLIEDEGLKLWRTEHKDSAGLMQLINTDVTDADSLVLRADVKVTRQVQSGTGTDGRKAPIAIAICYVDINEGEHCGDDIYWRGFFCLEPAEPNKSTNGQKVPRGFWYRFITDIMQLEPKPKFIKYISLEGSGWPEREGWVRDVHLIKKSREKIN